MGAITCLRYHLVVLPALVVETYTQDSVGVFSPGAKRYDRVSRSVISDRDSFLAILYQVYQAYREIALLGDVD